MDNHYRSIIKAASWRLLGTIDTMVITFLVTGHLKVAVAVGGIESVTKIILYYLHERAWNKVSAGRVEDRAFIAKDI